MNRICLLFLVVTTALWGMDKPSFKEFDRLAKKGKELNVVFLGGSLTWGANATDPNQYSYRALMGKYLLQRYPKARINLHDAAIGGTGSELGMFRLDRDVLAHNPDLVFLEYTVNDNLGGDDMEHIWSYEHILNTLVDKDIAVEVCMLGVKSSYSPKTPESKFLRRAQHTELGKAYNTAIGDTYPYIRAKVAGNKADLKEMYCSYDGTHPDNPGYKLIFEAIRNGFEEAVKNKTVCRMPKKTISNPPYKTVTRLELSTVKLPAGWEMAKNFRTAFWFDGQASRWQDGVAMFDAARNKEPVALEVEFTGSFIGLFGEADDKGLSFKAYIDGQLVPQVNRNKSSDIWSFDTKRFGKGRLFKWTVLSRELKDTKHTLKIVPVMPKEGKGQLRINSICSASRK